MNKDELKDEMKNKISMALKDPILQQGFEIICNENEQIEHLREERNYFQEKCEDIEPNYYCDHKGGCKVQELEKENADLKEECEAYAGLYLKSDDQLTKAKEIIKALLETPRTIYKRDEDGEVVPYENMAYARLKEDAEQFIKEIEK